MRDDRKRGEIQATIFVALLWALAILCLSGCEGYRSRTEADRFGFSTTYDAKSQSGGVAATWEHVYRRDPSK